MVRLESLKRGLKSKMPLIGTWLYGEIWVEVLPKILVRGVDDLVSRGAEGIRVYG